MKFPSYERCCVTSGLKFDSDKLIKILSDYKSNVGDYVYDTMHYKLSPEDDDFALLTLLSQST